jgi:hypothetical protein
LTSACLNQFPPFHHTPHPAYIQLIARHETEADSDWGYRHFGRDCLGPVSPLARWPRQVLLPPAGPPASEPPPLPPDPGRVPTRRPLPPCSAGWGQKQPGRGHLNCRSSQCGCRQLRLQGGLGRRRGACTAWTSAPRGVKSVRAPPRLRGRWGGAALAFARARSLRLGSLKPM